MSTLIRSGHTEEEEGGGTVGAARRFYTHHDNASRLLNCAHAHNGRHANGGALEVDPAAEEDRSRVERKMLYKIYRTVPVVVHYLAC